MEVKERILQKATDLFMRYGIRSITMDEIASQLGISKKTIYQFFTDKDDIVDAVVIAEIKENEVKCDRFRMHSDNAIHEIFVAVEEMEEMLKGMNPLIMYDLEKHHPRAHQKFRDHIHQFLQQSVKENLLRGIKEEIYRPDLNIEITAKHRLESIFMGFSQDIFPHNRFKMSDVFYELDVLFMHSVSTAKGKKMIDKYSSERIKQVSHEQKD
jgi:TetR/AcrR family transcriptional regulator, cholesterol catabolism regulator